MARTGPAPVHLALCTPPVTMLGYRFRHADDAAALSFATISEARAAMDARQSRRHRWQTRLAPHPASVRTARELITQACQAWQLPELRHDAALIMSELATNAVEHAGTEFVVTVFRRGRSLHLAVRDNDARYPRLGEPGGRRPALSEGGRGLALVHAAATGWGAMPTQCGKVVWATLSGG